MERRSFLSKGLALSVAPTSFQINQKVNNNKEVVIEQMQSGHIIFTFARYKFARRLLENNPKINVLELGCSEGLGTLHLSQASNKVVGVDQEANWINWAKQNIENENLKFICEDFLGKDYGSFDAVVSIDVIEHIPREKEKEYLEQLKDSYDPDAITEDLDKEEVYGVFIPSKLLKEESGRSCPQCNTYSFKSNDDVYMTKFECCFKCYVKWVEGREDRWKTGWRPNK